MSEQTFADFQDDTPPRRAEINELYHDLDLAFKRIQAVENQPGTTQWEGFWLILWLLLSFMSCAFFGCEIYTMYNHNYPALTTMPWTVVGSCGAGLNLLFSMAISVSGEKQDG